MVGRQRATQRKNHGRYVPPQCAECGRFAIARRQRDRPMRGGIPIQGDHPRGSMLFSRAGKEPLSGGHITPFAQEKVDGSTLLIDGAIEVDHWPLTLM
jgi:hypothetical protein